MLDGALFIVKCARYGNPGKNACSDFFCMTGMSYICGESPFGA